MAKNEMKKVRANQHRLHEVYASAGDLVCRILGERETTEKPIWTFLHTSAFRGYHEKCFELLRRDSEDLNTTNEFGETPLHLACMTANYRCIETLLDFEPKMNIQSDLLHTPLNLYLSRTPENEDILKKLLNAGANPDIPDKDGYSPLHTLAFQDESDKTELFARLLLKYRANIHSESNLNETPLHLAISRGRKSLVKVLLDSGASFTAFDVHGRTPIDISLEIQNEYPTVYHIVAKHVIIQYCLGFRMNLQLLEKLCNWEIHRNFKRICEEELQKLKSTFAGESTVSFYDILVLPTHTVAKYFSNANIVVSFRKFYMEESIFGPILLKKYEEAMERNYGIKLGILATKELLPSLPDLCVDKLLEYLDIEDFNNLYKATFSDLNNRSANKRIRTC
ncbi:hypothetical protein WA026_014573 [Henosepilachna vigintioctopunctata]|uniref:Uncharacterized protein n=1 Tax=Henosepilachna vigintioctopunctata TaxID=420089 RepID=A0AAW1VCG2_9CUCU